MNVLIVDDDRFVVASLKQKVNWTSLGVKQTFTASNIRQAKKIILEQDIHLLISDIEMPQGSGLELLAWCRSEGYNVQTIFLTNFANFNYAQKAIELQSFEYYLKPIEIDKLELILKKAIKKVQITQTNEDALKVSNYWQQNKQEFLNHFWTTYIRNSESIPLEELETTLQLNHIDYSMEACFIPLLIDLFPYFLNEKKEIETTLNGEMNLYQKLTTLVKEFFHKSPFSFESLIQLNTNNEQFVVILRCQNISNQTINEMQTLCTSFNSTIHTELLCDVQCSIGDVSKLIGMHNTTKKLLLWKTEYIDFRNKVLLFPIKHRNILIYSSPKIQLLDEYLQSGNKTGFINICKKYLTTLLNKNSINYHALCSFRLDITQLIFTHLNRKEILAHKLFQGKISNFLENQSLRSMEDMIIYITYLVDVSLEYMSFIHSQQSVVKAISTYIDENYHENITREDIAKIVYLSPDYIARIFKKETGISLLNYIIKKRIQIAKELLLSTNLPVHIISDRVGYGNYSYFTKIFKKETNHTPLEYRRIKLTEKAPS